MQDDIEHALALLTGFRLVTTSAHTGEYLVPSLLPRTGTRRMDAAALSTENCKYWGKYVFEELPPGAYEGLVVALSKNFDYAEIR